MLFVFLQVNIVNVNVKIFNSPIVIEHFNVHEKLELSSLPALQMTSLKLHMRLNEIFLFRKFNLIKLILFFMVMSPFFPVKIFTT